MEKIRWGIIGCGDVTEVKSGPAFNKVADSELVAVMRRDAAKAKDYAIRHNVSKWYSNAYELINDENVNAIYVATPPLQHEEYTIAALQAGKPVYIEKPMALNASAAERIVAAVTPNTKISVAHYRRAQPLFIKLKELLQSNIIGDPKFIDLKFLQPALNDAELKQPGKQWRVDPSVAGSGLFHDLAPHQLDLMLYYFGEVEDACGYSLNQGGKYAADDIVTGSIRFASGVLFQGMWCFTAPEKEAKDICEIVGSDGKLSFSVFGEPEIKVIRNGRTGTIHFEKLEHVQQPMIEKVVEYFLGKGENPGTGEDGVKVMQLMEAFTTKK